MKPRRSDAVDTTGAWAYAGLAGIGGTTSFSLAGLVPVDLPCSRASFFERGPTGASPRAAARILAVDIGPLGSAAALAAGLGAALAAGLGAALAAGLGAALAAGSVSPEPRAAANMSATLIAAGSRGAAGADSVTAAGSDSAAAAGASSTGSCATGSAGVSVAPPLPRQWAIISSTDMFSLSTIAYVQSLFLRHYQTMHCVSKASPFVDLLSGPNKPTEVILKKDFIITSVAFCNGLLTTQAEAKTYRPSRILAI